MSEEARLKRLKMEHLKDNPEELARVCGEQHRQYEAKALAEVNEIRKGLNLPPLTSE